MPKVVISVSIHMHQTTFFQMHFFRSRRWVKSSMDIFLKQSLNDSRGLKLFQTTLTTKEMYEYALRGYFGFPIRTNKTNSSNLYPSTKNYFRETCKSQNINPIAPTHMFTLGIIQIITKTSQLCSTSHCAL